MALEFTESLLIELNKWNRLNIFILVLSLINILIIMYKNIKAKKNDIDIFKNRSLKEMINLLSIITVLGIIIFYPAISKYAILITIFYYFYYIYIVPIFDLKDDVYLPSNIPEYLLILASGFYYYFSILFITILETSSLDNSSLEIIYIISLLMFFFTLTYCIFLNIYFILKDLLTHLLSKISNINLKNSDNNIMDLKKETDIYLKIVKICVYYLMHVFLYLIGIIILVVIFPFYLIRKIQNISLKKALSIIAKLSIIVSLITVYIIIKIDNYNESIISIYETLISVIIIPLLLEGLFNSKNRTD